MKTFFLMQKALIVFALITPLISVAGILIDGPATIELGIATRYHARTTGIITGTATEYKWINNTPSASATFQVSGFRDYENTITVNNTDATSLEVKLNLVQYNVIIKSTTTRTLAVVRPSSLLPNIQTDYNPDITTCNQLNTYKFAINKVAQGIGYNWVLPNGWQMVSSGQDGTQTFVNAKPTLINGEFPTGQVRVNVQQAAGYVATQTYNITFPFPVSINLIPYTTVCPNVSKNLTAAVGGGTGSLTYAWQVNNSTVDTDLSYSIPAPAVGATKIVSFTATDGRGCSKSQNVVVDNAGYQQWTFGTPYLNNVAPKKALGTDDESHSNLVIMSGGLPFYVGEDQKIWFYKWKANPTGYGNWENKVLKNTNNASGKLVFPEGSHTLYFTAGTDNSLYKADNASDSLSVVSNMAINNVNQLISDYHGNIFAATQNSIYKITSGVVTTVKTGLNPIANIATAVNKIYVLYTNGVIETFLLSDPNSAVVIPTVSPALEGSAFKADWAGNVFFVNNQFKIEVIKTGASTSVIAYNDFTGSKIPSGNFTVNRSTGTIYYNTEYGQINQLYKQGSAYQWEQFSNLSNQSTYHPYRGDLAIAQPNLFYIDEKLYVRQAYYSTAGCQPVAVREGEGKTEAAPLIETNISVAPNPIEGVSKLLINATENLSNASVFLYAFDGSLTASWLKNTNLEAGKHTIDINTEDLASGLYVVRLTNDDKTLSTVKVLVK